jgi:hypothetical protein
MTGHPAVPPEHPRYLDDSRGGKRFIGAKASIMQAWKISRTSILAAALAALSACAAGPHQYVEPVRLDIAFGAKRRDGSLDLGHARFRLGLLAPGRHALLQAQTAGKRDTLHRLPIATECA